jgi:hypothetical protein
VTTEAVIYQSVWDSSGNPVQQLSNLYLDGISTLADAPNTDGGKLYGSFTKSGATYTVNLYSDIAQTALVASGTATSFGKMTLNQANDSGISGSINLVTYTANDTLLQAVCILADDSALPQTHLETLSDYDASVGFAAFHVQAFAKIKEIVKSRFRSVLYNSSLVDSTAINGGLGGFVMSRV